MRVFVTAVLVLHSSVASSALRAQQSSCPPPSAPATEGAIVGRVVDGETGVPVGFALVHLRSAGATTAQQQQSRREGSFQFCAVRVGEVTLWAEVGQHAGVVGPVTIEAGRTLDVTLELRGAGSESGTLAGEVVSADTGSPVEGAYLLLPEVGRSSLTNVLGRFVFTSLPPGLHRLQVQRLGFADAEGRAEIEIGKITQIRVSLSVEAMAIEPLVVTAVRRRVELPELDDFERRYFSGWGQFVLEDDIRLRNPTKVTDLLYQTGANVGTNGGSLTMHRTGCAPMVYVDGVKITRLSRGGGSAGARLRPRSGLYLWPDPEANPAQEAADAVNLLDPSEVLAIEAYRGPAETPGQYLDSNSKCGVILIWSRRGRDLPRHNSNVVRGQPTLSA